MKKKLTEDVNKKYRQWQNKEFLKKAEKKENNIKNISENIDKKTSFM